MLNLIFLIINVLCAASLLNDVMERDSACSGFFLCIAILNIFHFGSRLV
jgi:hypothetical protein